MLVRVLRTTTVPEGMVTIEDIYDKETVAEIVIRFNENDLCKSCVEQFSELMNAQAKRWVERTEASDAESEWHPFIVRALRRPDLPADTLVVVDEDEHGALYIFAEHVITARGAAAFGRMMRGRVLTWVRVSASG